MTLLLYIPALLLCFFIASHAQIVNIQTSELVRKPRSLGIPHPVLLSPLLGDGGSDESDLLDIVVLASVDGKFHALNRTTGQALWSMPPFSSGVSAPSGLMPLVRTSHAEYDPDLVDEGTPQETYVIEPQSGDIYIMASPSSPLQRFPFSMGELVDMSPYEFRTEGYRRMFIGKKSTSLLVVELETGKIKATIDSECPWDPFDDLTGDQELDLDELDGSKPQRLKPTEVLIGRTDYHITIHTRTSSKQKVPVQNLSFSTYGPNNQDNLLQATYHRTPDNSYIQSLPNGEIISFRARTESQQYVSDSMMWGHRFSQPIVAIFDVLRSSASTYVLLQPRPPLSTILPLHHGTSMDQLPHLESAYIGLVEETGSLYAMSPDRFPLLVFGGEKASPGRLIDSGPAADDDIDRPLELDQVTAARKERQEAGREHARLDQCQNRDALYTHRRCLVGMRPLEGGDGDGPERRLKRLIDGVPRVLMPAALEGTVEGKPNTSSSLRNNQSTVSGTPDPSQSHSQQQQQQQPSGLAWKGVALAIVLGSTGLFFGLVRLNRTKTSTTPTQANPSPIAVEFVLPAAALSLDSPHATVTDVLEIPPSPLLTKSLPPLPAEAEDGEDNERDEEENTPVKRKTRRGGRGKKKKGGAQIEVKDVDDSEKESERTPSGISFTVQPAPAPSPAPSLIVSDSVLGYGSHGTVVYKGSLQGRAVAVKRLLQDFVTLASREVSILQESDDHPNVIRYYYQEAHSNFLYIALELCPATLADLVENPDRDAWRDIALGFEPKRALRQIASGLRHLHGLKLVHRDIKPQNILVSAGSGPKSWRMLISDFGLCKKLDIDQTSFLPTSHGTMAAGTVGWRAPEILRGDVNLDDMNPPSDDASVGSQGSVGSNSTAGKPTRLTKTVDIFALGCLFFYVLTNGGHPFGDRFEREANIMKGTKNLAGLERFGEEGQEAVDLIGAMIHPEAHQRPDTTTCLLHPYFWDAGRRLAFLQDASDRFEIMCRDPKDPHLLALERNSPSIVSNDWLARLDRLFIENLGKFRKYDAKSVQDLLRALRNKKHHYQDLPDNVKRHLGAMPEGYLAYFTRRFPRLFLHVHSVIGDSPLRSESMFRSYFEVHDS
ncbi:unnamed protein product [Mycena citricolor]|uniref:non-specific serine/threonine protein kinase n=1 Tax=Mycena citricolor TaxID=2018698 RepID=A0AAD2H726_9AGAR|nr:unnamed protein product [Mycena citricolor]